MSLVLGSRAVIAVVGWLLLFALVVWSLRNEGAAARRRCRRATARHPLPARLPRTRLRPRTRVASIGASGRARASR
ncbi:MAG TPA: hypothetical protein VK698_23040 [Kofleriaceae bacterium]|nr:hypothetical protein [Kofleriaceae bacterium]